MNFFFFLSKYNISTFHFSLIFNFFFYNFIQKFFFLNRYFLINELIWQEGFLIDFLQKKIIDNWIKKFLIYSSYLFNEKLIFDKLIRFYLDLIIWPLHKFSIFEYNNVSNILYINIFFFFFIVFLIFFFFFAFLIF